MCNLQIRLAYNSLQLLNALKMRIIDSTENIWSSGQQEMYPKWLVSTLFKLRPIKMQTDLR